MSVLATDNFNRADGALGANWTTSLSGTFAMNISSNVIQTSSVSNDASAHYNAVVWPNDQYSQLEVSGTGAVGGDQGLGVQCRTSTSAATHYRVVVDKAGANNVGLAKQVSGSYTNVWQRTSAWTNGDALRLETQGTSLRVYRAGVQLGATSTDSSVTAGSAGVFYSSTSSGLTGDNWEGGDFSVVGGGGPVGKGLMIGQAVRRAATW